MKLIRDASGLYLPSATAGGNAFYFVFENESIADATIDVAAELKAFRGFFAFVAVLPTPDADRLALAKATRLGMAQLTSARIGWLRPVANGYTVTHHLPLKLKTGKVVIAKQTGLRFKQAFNFQFNLDMPVGWNEGALRFDVDNAAKGCALIGLAGVAIRQSGGPLAGLPVLGEEAGRFQFDFTADDKALGLLRADVRMFSIENDTATARSFPVFHAANSAGGAIQLDALLDPFDTAIPVSEKGLPNSALLFRENRPVATHYRTTHGQQLIVTPAKTAKLVFCDDPDDLTETSTARFYLAPSGPFAVTVPQAAAAQPLNVLSGITGTEFIATQGGDVLVFEPGGAAGVVAPSDSGGPFLTEAARTSWLRIEPAAGSTTYVGEPENAPLYGGTEAVGAMDASTRPALLPFPGHGSYQVGSGDPAFPMLPFAGVAPANVVAGREIETAVARERRRIIGLISQISGSSTAADPNARHAATPQGLIRRFNSTKTEDLLISATESAAELEFRDLKQRFKDSLSRNRLMMVMTRNGTTKDKAFGAFASKVRVAGWQFDIQIDLADTVPLSERAVLIFKFDDRPLKDLLEDPTLWADAKGLNQDPKAVSQHVLEYLAEALGSTDGKYRRIREALKSPSWNGVLALNVPITEVAPGAACLEAGLKKDLYAHHLALELNDLAADLTVRQSAFFALIHYFDKYVAPQNPPDLAFHVETLDVLFENSKITSFSCKSLFIASSLFDERFQRTTFTLLGSYEYHDGKETYSFVNPDTHVIDVNSPVLRQIVIRRVALITVGSSPDVVTSQFLLNGDLSFGDVTGGDGAIDLFSIDALHFDKTGVDMEFFRKAPPDPNPRITFNPGDISVDVTVGDLRSLLKGFPLKLKRLKRWKDGPRLPDIGFIEFFSRVDAGCKLPRYGLFFELDLGSLGGLSSAGKDFRAELLLAWCGKSFFSGIKLPESQGGPKSLGLEGVLQILIDDFKFLRIAHPGANKDKDAYALVLRRCAIEILGVPLPSRDLAKRPDIYLFVDPDRVGDGFDSAIGWLVNVPNPADPIGPFTLERLTLGQRVGPKVTPQGISGGLDALVSLPDTTKAADYALFTTALGNLFHPDRGWLIGARMKIEDTITFGFLFNDPVIYGALLELPKIGFKIEITYAKVTENLGVYHAEITLPDSLRQWDFGAVSLTIPVVGVSIFTNGDFVLDVGYPHNLDFSRSCTVQAGIFLGSGGFYFGKLSGETTALLPPNPKLHTVVEIGLGMRVGLGREFRKGPMKAGISIAVYGMLEGALGYIKDADWDDPTEYLLRGEVGVIGQVFGIVDFGIVKAGLSVTIAVGFGIELGSQVDTVIWLVGRVRVDVTVVIGRIRIWRAVIEIRVSFSFETEIRYSWTLESKARTRELRASAAAGFLAAAVEPLSWTILASTAPKIPLEIFFVPEPSLRGGSPHVVGMLAIESPKDKSAGSQTPFDKLVDELVRWAVRLHLKAGPDDDPMVTAANMVELDARLHQPVTLARTKVGEPLDFAKLAAFLEKTFDVTVRGIPAGATVAFEGTVFPIIPDVSLVARIGSSVETQRNLWEINPRDEGYQDNLTAHFSRIASQFETTEVNSALAIGPVAPMSAIVFQDYFDFIIKAAIDRLEQELSAGTAAVKLSELLKATPFDDLSRMAARFFKQGLRLPNDFPMTSVDALYDLTGQQMRLPAESAITAPYSLALERRNGVTWFSVSSAQPAVSEMSKAEFFADLAGVKVEPRVDSVGVARHLRLVPRRFALQRHAEWAREDVTPGTTKKWLLWDLPPSVTAALRAQAVLDLQLSADEASKKFTGVPKPLATSGRFVTRIDLTVRGINPKVRNVYELGGANERNRHDLDALLDYLAASGAAADIRLVYRSKKDGPGLETTAIDPATVVLTRGNYSTETTPPADEELVATASASGSLDWAPMSDAPAFLRLVHDCSVVNTGGYLLRHGDSSELPPAVFADGELGKISLVVATPGDPMQIARRHHNALSIEKTAELEKLVNENEKGVLFATAPAILDAVPLFAPGCVAFEIVRQKPAENGTPSDYFETLYNLLEYKVVAANGYEASAESLPLTPVREESGGQPPWIYRQSIPLFELLPQPRQRYAAVGRDVTLAFDFLDYFGNKLAWRDQRAMTKLPVRYSDDLIALGAWPSVASTYTVEKSGNAAKVSINLHFDHAKWIGKLPEELQDLQKRAKLIGDQLRGPGVTLSVETSLLRAAHPLPQADFAKLLAFVDAIARNPAAAVTDCRIEVPVPAATSAADKRDWFELTVEVVIARNDSLIDPNAPQDSAIRRVATSLAPPDAKLATPKTLIAFAEKLEAAIPAIRLAIGTSATTAGPALHAVRIGKGGAVSFRAIGKDVRYYALPPLTTSRVPGDIDYDVTARRFLEAVDWFVGPELAPRAVALDAPSFEAVAGAKRRLAGAIAGQLTPVLKRHDPAGDALLPVAQETLRQKLLINLATSYKFDAVVAFPFDVASHGTPGPREPRLYGSVVATERTSPLPPLSITPAKVPLGVTGKARASAFLVDLGAGENVSTIPAALQYQVSHLEYFVDEKVDKFSRWLKFVQPLPLAQLGDVDIPIPIRRYPLPPVLQHDWKPDAIGATGSVIETARAWRYDVTYESDNLAQDTLFLEIDLNVAARAATLASEVSLLDALDDFSEMYPVIEPKLREIAETGTGDAGALSRFAKLVGAVTDAWEAWGLSFASLSAVARPPLKYEIEEKVAQGVIEVTVSRADAGHPFPVAIEIPNWKAKAPTSPNNFKRRYVFNPGTSSVIGRRRALVFSPFDVLTEENAWPGMHLKRNFRFNAEPAHDVFVYRTPLVRAAEPVVVLLDRPTMIDISKLGASGKKPVRVHLETLFGAIFRDVPHAARRLKVEARYGFNVLGSSGPLSIDVPGQLIPRYPLTFTPPFELELPKNGNWASETVYLTLLEKQLTTFIADEKPGIGGSLLFDIAVYAAEGEESLPVLRLSNLQLPLSMIQ